jgi:Fatty acid hydroxylase
MSGRTALNLAERDALRARLVARAPSWYSPRVHQLLPSAIGLATCVAAIALLRNFQTWQLATLPLTFILLNANEWRVHRSLLHRRTPPFQLLYDRHTPEHHMVFLTEDMSIRSRREYCMVLIPAFGILAAFGGAIIPAAILALCGLWNVGILFCVTSIVYVICYEQLHLSFHLPPESFIGRRKIIAFLRRHHAIHHHPERMQRWNFNVVLPLWDLVRGTIYRSEGAGEIAGAADGARR